MVAIHRTAFIVTIVVGQVLGMVWYSPTLFGDTWAKAIGKGSIKAVSDGVGVTGPLAGLFLHIFSLYVQLHFFVFLDNDTIGSAIQTVVWGHLGFNLLNGAGGVIWKGASAATWTAFFIGAGFQVVRDSICAAVYYKILTQPELEPAASPRGRRKASPKTKPKRSKSPRSASPRTKKASSPARGVRRSPRNRKN